MGSNPSIESARQATERPKHQTVVDITGKMLQVGDTVIIRATVEALNPDGYGTNVILRSEAEMPAVASYGPHRSQMHLHGRQVALVERSSR